MDNIKFVSKLEIKTASPYDGLVKQIFGSNLFYCYDVLKNIFIPINIDVECSINHRCIFIRPYKEDEASCLTHVFLVLPVFFYRDMFFSVNADLNLRLLKSGAHLKELKFSIEETFKFNNRAGHNVAKIINENIPNYSYIINNLPKLKKELLGAFHYVLNSACASPHKGKLEEEIRDKIENNII